MKTNNLCFTTRLAAALVFAVLANVAAAAEYLDLAQGPLFSGTNAVPNVMVAVDDSGSMDREMLFPTDDGALYWNDSKHAAADSNGVFYDSASSANSTYGYVYPFDDQLLRGELTIPPIPTVAYARAADYNKSYFDPTVEYKPWLGYPQATDNGCNQALYDPNKTDCNKSIDLSKTGNGNFAYKKGMVIPGSDGNGQLPPGVKPDGGYVCFNPNTNDIKNVLFGRFTDGNDYYYCYARSSQGGYVGYGPSYNVKRVADLPGASDETVANSEIRNVAYYPATFYVRNALAASYGYTAETLEGLGPDGKEKLVGYEIKRENFGNDSDYAAAMQNFANWFTYYRKRHLATRGGIVAAFDRISDIRVGSCTINGREALEMKELDDPVARADFYSDIFNIDYSKSRGTPNRQALDFLGRQLETNDSIITAPCQRNFAILFTDGYSGTKVDNEVGNVDGTQGKPFADGYTNTIADIAMEYYKNLDAPYQGILRVPSECSDKNPDPRLDCETDLHMTTFGVTLNQTGLLFNTKDEPNPFTDENFSWPNPNTGGNDKAQVDDLWHATINSRGDLLNAATPAEIANKFTTALERILGEEGSGTGISLESSSFMTDSLAYQASFIAGAWSGELKALPQAEDGGFGDPKWRASNTLSDPNDPNFTTPANRTILTNVRRKCSSGDSYDAVAFKFSGSIESNRECLGLTQTRVDFLRGERSGERANDGSFRNRNSNILGDIVHSTPVYVGAPNRIRYPADWNDLLQDGNESPPEENTPYLSSFAQGSAKDRTPMVYVGANDGMLHGFDAETGKERLAFIPGALLGSVGQLADSNYQHRYYVDESPASGDAIIDNQWRTVLVGGLGGGGRSIYALDVTDPSSFSENDPDDVVLWEYQDEELGNTFGKPAIVRLHDGRWAAVFGNGYNSNSGSAQLFIVDIASGKLIKKIDTGAKPSDTPDACALDVDLGLISIGVDCKDKKDKKDKDKGKDEDDDDDDDDEDDGDGDDSRIVVCHKGKTKTFKESKYDKHRDHTTRGACGSQEGDDGIVNGLGEVFPVDLDGDFITDYIYAGDLRGNLWRFDLTSESSGGWEVGLDGKPLFKATDKAGQAQPITAQPQVATHPYGTNYGAMVYFGTGKYLEASDRQAKTEARNSFYGIQDVDVFTFNEANGGKGTYNTTLTNEIPRNRLQAQTIDETVLRDGSTYRLVSDNPFRYQMTDDTLDDDSKRGWYIDLPVGEGELISTNAQVKGNTVGFSTTIPNTKQCAASGSGYFMLVDRRTGGRTSTPAFDLNGDNQLNIPKDSFTRQENGKDIAVGASGLMIVQGIPNEAAYQVKPGSNLGIYYLPDSSGGIRNGYVPLGPDRRRSWREIRR